MRDLDPIRDLARDTFDSRSSRRQILRRAALLAVSVPTLGSLLAACGGDDDDGDDDTASTSTTSTGQPGAGTPTTAEDAEEATATVAEEEESPTTAGAAETPASSGSATESIVIDLNSEISNLDTHQSGGNQDNIISKNIYSRLVYTQRFEEDTEEVLPDLATAWERSEDGKEIAFTLRENVEWHKGYGPLTATDVVYTLDRVRDPEQNSRWRADYANVIEVVEESPTSVRVVMENPDPLILQTAFARTGFILNQKALEDLGEQYSTDPIGSGAYIFDSWTKGERLVLVRNEGHWLHQDGNIQEATFRFLDDDRAAQLGYEAGELDAGYIERFENQVAVVENDDLATYVRAHSRTHNVDIGTLETDDIVNDVNFRRALALSVDRQALAEEAMLGMGQPAYSLLNPNHYGWIGAEPLYPFDFNLDAAQEALSESAYDGQKIELLSYPDYDDIGVLLQAFWQAIGIDCELVSLETAIYNERRNSGEFQLMNAGGAREYPEQVIYPQFTSDGIPVNNQWGYTGIDDLGEQLRFEQDMGVRTQIIGDIQRKLAEDVPGIPLVYPSLVFVTQPYVKISFVPAVAEIPLWHMRVER